MTWKNIQARHSAVRYSAIQYSAARYSTARYSAARYSAALKHIRQRALYFLNRKLCIISISESQQTLSVI